MRLYDLDEEAQQDIHDSGQEDNGPVFDNSSFGSRSNLGSIKI
jgi:hypothetical protein